MNQPHLVETAFSLAATLCEETSRSQPEATRVAELLRQLLETVGLSAPALARHLGVAPQTVNRWRNGQAVPRPRQAQKLQEWLSGYLSEAEPVIPEVEKWSEAPDAVKCLGVRFANEVLALEGEARAVWIVKSGELREGVRGAIGESVLRGLRHGTHFHYLFLEGTAAARTFRQLTQWLQDETFAGQVTGYEVRDDRLARAIGLTEAPGAWIGLEYSPAQATRLGRHFDVLFALGVREYADVGRTQIKNEDGQACWLELATPQAARWLSLLSETARRLEDDQQQGDAKVIRLSRRNT